MTLTVVFRGIEHSVTIPRHNQLKAGTLASILADVAQAHDVAPSTVRMKLFG